MRALAKDPERRFKDADAFLKALDAAESAPDTPRPQDTAVYAAVDTGGRTHRSCRRGRGGVRGGQGRRRRWRWIVLALLVAGVAALVAYALTRPRAGHRPRRDRAARRTRPPRCSTGRGFDVDIKAVPSAGAARTRCSSRIRSRPTAAGARSRRARRSMLSVSSGPAIVAVPTVKGLSESDATKRLENAGLQGQRRVQQFSKTVPRAGRSAPSRPPAPSSRRLQPVTLLVSRGSNTVVVPNVVGLNDQAGARRRCRTPGLGGTERPARLDASRRARSSSQSPAAGTQRRRGTRR